MELKIRKAHDRAFHPRVLRAHAAPISGAWARCVSGSTKAGRHGPGATQIYRDGPLPVILVSAYHDAEFIRRAEADHILSYLVKPIKQADLVPAIALAVRRFEQFQTLRREASDLKQALEDRKTIEKAKGLMMKKAGLDEADVFKRL